jgi:16S rRNA (cytosine1402-N4)-methyltransferase
LNADSPNGNTHRRRPRYSGKNPRRFEEKYKELAPEKYPETVARVRAAGKTPAGMHVPIMVNEILEILNPQPAQRAVDCTLGYGGHALAILRRLQPGGQLIGLDVDPLEFPKTEARLQAQGYGPESFLGHRSNFAGLPQVLATAAWPGADCILADLGVSSMQIDTPGRGFSVKHPGPLDMRMNPNKGQSAAAFLRKISPEALAEVLAENADEPEAVLLAGKLAGQEFAQTLDCVMAIRTSLKHLSPEGQELSVRRVFQALRIAVNEEFTALDRLLCHLPGCLTSGGCVAILTFHSGEDRRVKKSFQAGFRTGIYSAIADEVVRAGSEECRANSRATSAKLRWARRS